MPKLYNRHHKNAPPGSVYIGRGTAWGNPFLIGLHGTREQVIQQYREWIEARPRFQQKIKRDLKGKNLVCSCAPAPCHGDILLDIANG